MQFLAHSSRIMAALLSLAGCEFERLGDSARYFSEASLRVEMPATAPSISQQFFAGPHNGIDLLATDGTPVLAAASGRVAQSFFEPAYGNTLILEHASKETGTLFRTVYKHLQTRIARPGDRVTQGQQIAELGRSGILAGGFPHLHFEVLRGFTPEDPNLYWRAGPGRVTCPAAAGNANPGRFATSFPLPCAPDIPDTDRQVGQRPDTRLFP